MHYENFNLTDIVMPVKVDVLQQLLWDTGFDKEKSDFLIDKFINGFPIGYDGDTNVKMRSPSLKLNMGSECILWNKVMKEVKLNRYVGPFKDIPYDNFIQSPIGLVPKDNGKDVQLILPKTAKKWKKIVR